MATGAPGRVLLTALIMALCPPGAWLLKKVVAKSSVVVH